MEHRGDEERPVEEPELISSLHSLLSLSLCLSVSQFLRSVSPLSKQGSML